MKPIFPDLNVDGLNACSISLHVPPFIPATCEA